MEDICRLSIKDINYQSFVKRVFTAQKNSTIILASEINFLKNFNTPNDKKRDLEKVLCIYTALSIANLYHSNELFKMEYLQNQGIACSFINQYSSFDYLLASGGIQKSHTTNKYSQLETKISVVSLYDEVELNNYSNTIKNFVKNYDSLEWDREYNGFLKLKRIISSHLNSPQNSIFSKLFKNALLVNLLYREKKAKDNTAVAIENFNAFDNSFDYSFDLNAIFDSVSQYISSSK